MDRIYFSLRWLVEATRRRFWIIAFFAVIVFGVTLFHLSKATPLYRAIGVIEIQPENPPGIAKDEVSALMAGFHWGRYLGTQEMILSNRALAEKALERIPLERQRHWGEPADLASALSAGIQTEPVNQTFLVRIYCTSASPEAAAQFLNALMEAYVEQSSSSFGERSRTAAGQLSQRALPELERSLSESVDALNAFLGREGNSDLEQRHDAALDRWKSVSAKVGEVRLRRVELESRLSRWGDGSADPERLAGFPEVRENLVIRDLRTREVEARKELSQRSHDYKERHPEIVALQARIAWIGREIDRELGRIRSALQLDFDAARREDELLHAELDGLEQQLSGLRAGLFELKQLRTKVETRQTTYNTFYAKYGETTAVADISLASVRILEPAVVPMARFYPRWSTAGVMALIFFLLGSAGLLLLFERLDDTIRFGGEVEETHGLAELASVPVCPSLGVGSSPVKPLGETDFAALEAFRRLRTDVLYRLMTDAQRRVVAIVSSGPGEGKTTVALRLAEAVAMMDKRVLIIDGDLRRPSLHRAVGNGQHGDLKDVLIRAAEPSRVIRGAAFGKVDAAYSTEPIPNPTELLGGAPFKEFMEYARKNYDVIILDTPPVLLASDALLLAKQADVALLVVRIGVTSRRHVTRSISELKAFGIVPAGLVFNAAREVTAGSYGYGYGYSPEPPKTNATA